MLVSFFHKPLFLTETTTSSFQCLHCYSIGSFFADFDNEIESGKSKLSDILDREDSTVEQNSPINNYSFGSFSSTITKKRADGVKDLTFMICSVPYLSSVTYQWLLDNHIGKISTYCSNAFLDFIFIMRAVHFVD